MAKRLFFVCEGLFLLALSYHLGATNAQGQAGATVSGFSVSSRYDGGSGPGLYVLTPNGDLYFKALGQFGFATQTRLIRDGGLLGHL
jgi:hypothetical protein